MKIDVWDLYCFEEYPEEMEIIDITKWDVDNLDISDLITYIANFRNEEYDDVRQYSIHEIEGLFNEKIEFDCDKDFWTIQLDFYHPKMIRNVNFDYENYIKTRIKTIAKSLPRRYKTKIFWLPEINFLQDPIGKIILIVEDN